MWLVPSVSVFVLGESAEPEAEGAGAGKIANALKALDFGSGRERGMRSYQREKYEEQQQKGQPAPQVAPPRYAPAASNSGYAGGAN